MTILSKLWTILLLCQGVTASYQNLSQAFDPGHPLSKRWYSVYVPDHPPLEHKGEFGPWPIVDGDTPKARQAIRCCFFDGRSEKRLRPIFEQAVQRWAPGLFPHTGLHIELDEQNHAVCDFSEEGFDLLAIHDKTVDVTSEQDQINNENCPTFSESTGYDYGLEQVRDNNAPKPLSKERKHRHRIEFCHLKPGSEVEDEPLAVRAMMHEFAHAAGLAHEHQRPDRDQYLHYRCRNLHGYDEEKLRQEVEEDYWQIFEAAGVGKDEVDLRMKLICQQEYAARNYLKPAVDYIIGSELSDHKWANLKTSSQFDFESITIYDSTANSKFPVSPKYWVQWQKGNKQPVWQGGSQDPTKAKLSKLDIEGIKVLYPLMLNS